MSEEIFDKKERRQSAVRSMPSSEDAERGLLSSCLQDAGVIDEYVNLPAEAFHLPGHRALWGCLQAMRAMNKPVDLVTVTEQLIEVGELESIGGPAWLTDVWNFIPTSANADYYVKIVMDRMIRRRIITTANRMSKLAYEEFELTAEEVVESVEGQFLELRNEGSKDALNHIAASVKRVMEKIEHTYRNRGKPSGMATGFTDLDRMTTGLHPGQLVVLAARPSMGKSCFMMQMARSFAEQGPVAVFSLEMSQDEITERLIALESKFSLSRIKDGFLQKTDFAQLPMVYGRLVKQPIFIDETPALTVLDFRSRARRAVVRHGARVIFVDYLQLMKSPGKGKLENRALEVAEISMTLKACAKELRVPVIAVAQLNREAEGRSSAPRLSDLRESGQIEQDADIVMMLHRPKKDRDDEGAAGVGESMEVHIVKQRNGPVGHFNLRFVGEHARFENETGKLFSNNEAERQRR